jgi:hypothetical protein
VGLANPRFTLVLVEDIVNVVGGVLLVLDFFGIVGVLELLHFDTYLQRELVTENLSRRWRRSEILIRHLITSAKPEILNLKSRKIP